MPGHRICAWLGSIVLASILWSGPGSAGTFAAQDGTELEAVELRVRAAHFLSRATFGPTLDEIDALAARMETLGTLAALEEWIDRQLALPPTHHEPLALQMIADDGFDPFDPAINPNRYKHHAWWHAALTAPDQLRQRVAWALVQIFVINEYSGGFGTLVADASGRPQYLGVADYYDMLLDNAFGNYRQLLEDVTLHPIMGAFLTHLKNPKADASAGRFPDENFARESMQLFSIGLYDVRRDGVLKRNGQSPQVETYDNQDVETLARVFTGLSYARGQGFWAAATNFHEPMQMYEPFHDTGEKVLPDGTVLPAGRAGLEDIADALDHLFRHPNTPPFVARLLIQRLVRSNPSKHYIRRVSRAFEGADLGTRGDLGRVIKAILLDKEALDSQRYLAVREPLGLRVEGAETELSRLREPVIRYAAFLRAFDAWSDYGTGRFMIPALDENLNQAAYRSPSVGNFYQSDHRPSGEILGYTPSKQIPNGTLVAPEFEIFTSEFANRFANQLRSDVRDATATFTLYHSPTVGAISSNVLLDFSLEAELAATPAALLDHLDLLLCYGSLSDASRQIVGSVIAEETQGLDARARGAILAVLTAPECAVDG